MDLSSVIVPKSDQLNSDDLIPGPVTVTIESVTKGSSEQPVNVHLVEYPGRAYRPNKSMSRVLVKAWGKESDVYAGRRMTLYRDPDVKWGGQKVGGIKISHLSHIDKPFSMALTETRGKRVLHTVEPLRDDAPKPARKPAPDVDAIDDVETLRAMWQSADAATRKRIEARVAALQQQPAEPAFDDTEWLGGEPA